MIVQLSSAAGAHANEDLIATYEHGDGVHDIVVFDGASSISEKYYFDEAVGDPAWFVRTFATLLQAIVSPGLSQEDSITLALAQLRQQLQAGLDTSAIPDYAYPIAAMTWLRIHDNGDAGATVSLYALGDCKTFLLDEHQQVHDLDPYDNPQEEILKEAIARLRAQGVSSKEAIREQLLPMLRERRAYLNTQASPTILCLHPRGEFKARTTTLAIDRPSRLLAVTDGFYRLVDTYGLYSTQELVRQCAHSGLHALMQELRDFEQANLGSGETSVKKSDDASAVMHILS